MLSKNSKIFLAGHRGMVGSAILRKLKLEKYKNLILIEKKKLDLLDQKKVYAFLKKKKPQVVIIAAARVGGILANYKNKAGFIYENLQVQNNLIHGSYLTGVKNLLFLGSSCIYPKNINKPISENMLLTGKLEETNDAYAIAKIAGIKLCESYNFQYGMNYKCLMPTNTFGPGDNYDENDSHFLPALIKKIHHIKKSKNKNIYLWGNGKAKREVIFVDDLADAIVYFLNKKTKHFLINVGSGIEKTIKDYSRIVSKALNTKINIVYVKKNLNGTPRKLLDLSLSKKYGWKSKLKLVPSIKKTYEDFIKNINEN